jgi:hypothetical protein
LKFICESIAPLDNQLLVRTLAALMLKLLQMLDAFHTLMRSGDFEKSVTRCASEKLKHAKLNPKFSGRFVIALCFISDTFLKHGNTFKSQVRQSHLILLLTLLSEKDILVNVHCHNLFWRVGTT